MEEKVICPIRGRPPGPNEPNFRYSGIYTSINTVLVFSRAIGAFWDIAAEIVPYYDVNERVYYMDMTRRTEATFASINPAV